MSEIYNFSQLIGKTLFADRNNVHTRTYANDIAPIANTYRKGQAIGVVFSWITKNSNTWFMLEDNNFLKYETGIINEDKIKEQGAQTVKEELEAQKQKENATWFSNFFGTGLFQGTSEALQTAIKIVLIVLTALIVLKLYKTLKP